MTLLETGRGEVRLYKDQTVEGTGGERSKSSNPPVKGVVSVGTSGSKDNPGTQERTSDLTKRKRGDREEVESL